MSTITKIRQAKCKDCSFCESQWQGRRKTHRCHNVNSERYKNQIKLKDFVIYDDYGTQNTIMIKNKLTKEIAFAILSAIDNDLFEGKEDGK